MKERLFWSNSGDVILEFLFLLFFPFISKQKKKQIAKMVIIITKIQAK